MSIKQSSEMDYYSTWGVSNWHGEERNQQMDETTISKESTKKGKNKKLSADLQSVAARERRHRIRNRFKMLQSLIPGGYKMDTASMLDEAIKHIKFLKTQIWLHQLRIHNQHVGHRMQNYNHIGPLPAALHNNSISQNIINLVGVQEALAITSQVSLENCYFQGDQQMMYFDEPTMYSVL